MKKNIIKRFFALVLALTLIVQIPVFNSFAVSASEPRVAASGDFVGTLQRAIYGAILYSDGLKTLVKDAQLTSFRYDAVSDSLTLIKGSFRIKGFVTQEFSISVTVGTKSFWTGFVNSPQYKIEQSIHVTELLLSYIAFAIPNAYSYAKEHLNGSSMATVSGILFRNHVRNLTSDESLALIPSFSITKKMGNSVIGTDQFLPTDDCVIFEALGEDLNAADAPSWVNDGVTT